MKKSKKNRILRQKNLIIIYKSHWTLSLYVLVFKWHLLIKDYWYNDDIKKHSAFSRVGEREPSVKTATVLTTSETFSDDRRKSTPRNNQHNTTTLITDTYLDIIDRYLSTFGICWFTLMMCEITWWLSTSCYPVRAQSVWRSRTKHPPL